MKNLCNTCTKKKCKIKPKKGNMKVCCEYRPIILPKNFGKFNEETERILSR